MRVNDVVFKPGERVLHEMKSYVVGEAGPKHIFLQGTDSAISLTGPNPHAKLMRHNEFHAGLGRQCLASYEDFVKRERSQNDVIENGRVIFASYVQAWRIACDINHFEASRTYLEQTLPELAGLRIEQRTIENCARRITDRKRTARQ